MAETRHNDHRRERLPKRELVAGRIYYSVQYEHDDVTQPTVVSYKYTGKRDRRGRALFAIIGAPPAARMTLETSGEADMLDLVSLIAALRKEQRRLGD